MDEAINRETAVLVSVQLPKMTEAEIRSSLTELTRLVNTLGYEVIGTLTQKRAKASGATIIGKGKLKELARWTKGAAADRDDDSDASDVDTDADDETGDEFGGSAFDFSAASTGVLAKVVVFDCDLTPSQMRNLEVAAGTKVLDRTGVIIEIFSRHARSRAAMLQVEIARLNYLAPRLRETGGQSERQGGGIGGKGSGETSLELDRREIRDRIKELRHELESVQNEHQIRRGRRSGENSVALVGYTNAGKSSLMRGLTGSSVYVADKLFATLDTTVRPLHPDTVPRILISDTVGFIDKLPHDLVASFRSTLDEALGADILLHVVDASDPAFRSQLAVTRSVLAEIGAGEIEHLVVLNKRDCLGELAIEELRREFPAAVFISTRIDGDLTRLRSLLIDFFDRDLEERSLFVPWAVQGAIGEIRGRMRVVREEFNENGVRFLVRARPEILKSFDAKYSIS